ncbi:unnamed protein product [Blepharisma stoltei]|uniref:protein-serine/threonine phosphatase n=1 Tax=Blepharisma stoltei TaxID=1481888 RepID=A0AAU9KDB0_9CILI|nr:unnamed protein product [Blepharisma stoltei]
MNVFFKSVKSPSSETLPSIRGPRVSETPTPRYTKKHLSGKSIVPSSSVPNFDALPDIKLRNLRHVEVTPTFPQISLSDRVLPRLLPSTISNSSCGKIRAYAANTHQGLTRLYNEDKAIIILKIKSPLNQNRSQWPNCSFFGLYDGHGGKACSNFLRDNLHHYIINDPLFPDSPKQAILRGFSQAESDFLKLAKETNEKAGSCALVVLIVGKMCYVANVGDSRAAISASKGQQAISITRDHKPNDPEEQKRIQENGGSIYYNPSSQNIIYRVSPGRLSVSRTIGDIDAKDPAYGGNQNVLIATPEIKSFKIKKQHDFIMMGCDGVFDVMSTKDVVSTAWNSNLISDDLTASFCRNAVEEIVTQSMKRGSSDNLTAIVIAFGHEDQYRAKSKCA